MKPSFREKPFCPFDAMKCLRNFSLALLATAAITLSSCASGDGYSGSGSPSSPYASSPFSSWYDSPMAQQVRMQEAQSKMMRSMIPF